MHDNINSFIVLLFNCMYFIVNDELENTMASIGTENIESFRESDIHDIKMEK